MPYYLRIAIVAALLVVGVALVYPSAKNEPALATVVEVLDGDTIRVLRKEETVTIRLEGIDAPERNQRFGGKAKQYLTELSRDKGIIVIDKGRDRYGRTLGIVTQNGIDLQSQMLEAGLAWHYKKYNSEVRLAKLEEAARIAKRGLWSDESPLPPWEFRERQRTALPPADSDASGEATDRYWLNTNTGVRHNSRCEHFQKTSSGRFCGHEEGKACGICGG